MRSLLPLAFSVLCVAAFGLLRADHPTHPDDQEHNGVRVIRSKLALDFPGATEFAAQPECTDSAPDDPCVGEWHHKSGQRVRVLVVPVPDKSKLVDLAARIQRQVEPEGGKAIAIEQAGQRLVRVVRPVKADDGQDLVVIEYILISPDDNLLHMVTSSAPLEQQAVADGRVRDLLAFAAWVQGS